MGNQDTDEIKLLPNGSVDFGYYNAHARELKIEMRQTIGRRIAAAVRRSWGSGAIAPKQVPIVHAHLLGPISGLIDVLVLDRL